MFNRTNELAKLIGIPPAPKDNIGDWNDVENKLGLLLPTDYKQFIEVFGVGYIGHWLEIHSPFSANRAMNFFELNKLIRLRYETQIELELPFPYSMYPDSNGLLAWGKSVDALTTLWSSSGDADQWGTVVWDPQRSEFFEYPDLSMTAFLEKAVTGTLSPRAFGPDTFWGPPVFTS